MIVSPLLFSLLLLTPVLKADSELSNRNLSKNNEEEMTRPKIAGYQPKSSTVLANIDLDHAEMSTHLSQGTEESFEDAKHLYEQGANAKPYALLELQMPLNIPLMNGSDLVGETPDGSKVVGTILGNYEIGATDIGFLYKAFTQHCAVGASLHPEVWGCLKQAGALAALSGTGDTLTTLYYTYNPTVHNKNRLSIQRFSTTAKAKMNDCDGSCPFHLYTQFVNYYGSYSYADDWIQAAFEGHSTDLEAGNGNFKNYGFAGRSEIIKRGTVYLNVFMVVQNELHNAVANCNQHCDEESTDCNTEAIHSWDLAVAWYSGSLEGEDFLGSKSGRFLHSLAEERCESFNTCNGLQGLSSVNDEIFQRLHAGQHKIGLGKCTEVKKIQQRISRLMMVPLIQEVLWHAHITDTKPEVILNQTNAPEKISAGAAVSAAAILPMINYCSPVAADTIYRYLKTGAYANFDHVKEGLESTYYCLGITCEDVGGLWHNGKGMYFENTEPCGLSTNSITKSQLSSSSGGCEELDTCLIVCGVIIACIALFTICYRLSGYTKKDRFTTALKVPPPEILEAGETSIEGHDFA